jgi:hypothetical protein
MLADLSLIPVILSLGQAMLALYKAFSFDYDFLLLRA